ncbi:MAG: type VI secretion system baseplate subunit TssK [Deltaproteobacteria bacterium]|nr:type VI secretion system baseplate subunit TssK [Deltaproteobacteria bacterium]
MMISKRPLFWHQGLFLQPQHFQYLDLFNQSLLSPVMEYQHPYFWGVVTLDVNEAALANRRFELQKGEFLFQDGTATVFPTNCVIQSRSFDDAWVEGERPFTIYLGLRKFNEETQNVTVLPQLDNISDVTTRFVTTEAPEAMVDMYGNGPQAQVKRLHYVLKIFWENELEELQNYNLIPLAQLQRDGNEIKLSQEFIPPLVAVSGSAEVVRMIRDIRDQVTARCRQLEEYKSPREIQSTDFESGYMIYLLALRSLNRFVPTLNHLTETPNIHPWAFYGVFRQLIGELSTFAEQVSATGELLDGTQVLPNYDHEDLWACFSSAHNLIGSLLNRIIIGPEHIIRLKRDGDYFAAEIPANAFDSRNIFYLVIRTNIDPDSVPEIIQTIAKLSSSDHISTLISRALHGVSLEQSLVPPPGLPRRPNSFYFKIDHYGSQWSDVQRSQNISLYWDTAPDDLLADIVILRGT